MEEESKIWIVISEHHPTAQFAHANLILPSEHNFAKLTLFSLLCEATLKGKQYYFLLLLVSSLALQKEKKTEVRKHVLLFVTQGIESRLKVTLPDDLPASLADGVVLCHLINHISKGMIPSIHIPSAGVVSIHLFMG